MDLLFSEIRLHFPTPVAEPFFACFKGTAAPYEQALSAVLTEHLHGMALSDATSLLLTRPVSCDVDISKYHQKPSPPYRFSYPHASSMGPVVYLLVASPALPFWGLLIRALIRVMACQHHNLVVTARCEDGSYLPVDFEHHQAVGDLPLCSLAEMFHREDYRFNEARQVLLQLRSPLRLVHGGRELSRLLLTPFIAASLRRLSSFTAYYGTSCNRDQIRSLILLSDEFSMERVAAQTDLCGTQRGLRGAYRLSGPCSRLMPWLSLAGFLQIGKGNSYGMGSFTLSALLDTDR